MYYEWGRKTEKVIISGRDLDEKEKGKMSVSYRTQQNTMASIHSVFPDPESIIALLFVLATPLIMVKVMLASLPPCGQRKAGDNGEFQCQRRQMAMWGSVSGRRRGISKVCSVV